jgi:hypothetical protein
VEGQRAPWGFRTRSSAQDVGEVRLASVGLPVCWRSRVLCVGDRSVHHARVGSNGVNPSVARRSPAATAADHRHAAYIRAGRGARLRRPVRRTAGGSRRRSRVRARS